MIFYDIQQILFPFAFKRVSKELQYGAISEDKVQFRT